jgi:hypothetical protein
MVVLVVDILTISRRTKLAVSSMTLFKLIGEKRRENIVKLFELKPVLKNKNRESSV